ncbi:MAG: PIG-L family deacetylase [Candidatus Promineifilaceae bacterium]|nr:PIG-L family deacetylase [Candidatus Promineifilaceae bacterium]
MPRQLRLMCILAHPDDESLGTGGILARYGAEGVQTYLLTATHGGMGWFGAPEDNPGPEALGRLREQELGAAANVLGLKEVNLLGYQDGQLDRADPAEVTARIVAHVRRVRPQVVVTFDPYGSYGHPDHIAISQLATAALVAAADPDYANASDAAHTVDKLYYFVVTPARIEAYEAAFGTLMMEIDGVQRRPPGWPYWAVTTRIDTADFAEQVWQATACHRSQLPNYQALRDLPPEKREYIWQTQSLYRVYSLVNGGRGVERDLFAGLR